MTDQLHAALGRITSGVYILTIGQGDQSTGMLASWVMQAGFEAPMVTVAVRQGRYVADWLARGDAFVLNIVGEHQKHLLRHFGRGFEPGEPAFSDVVTHLTESGGIPVLDDALGYLECEPVRHMESDDHRIVLARITAGHLTNEVPPMVHIRKNGAHY